MVKLGKKLFDRARDIDKTEKINGEKGDVSDRDKVSEKWGQFAEDRATNPEFNRVFAWDQPLIQEYVFGSYLDGESPFVYVRKFLPRTPCESGLEVGCGSGELGISVVDGGLCNKLYAFDVSKKAIELAGKSAREQGKSTILFEVADGNNIILEKNSFDFIYASQSLHHIENLEHLYDQIAGALTDDGIFFVNDYVGPTRMQYTDKQLSIMNSILSILPDRYRVSILHENQVRSTIERTSIEDFMRIDPSEGVRSAEILPLAKERFDMVDIRPMGSSIINELLLGIINNFDENSEHDRTLLRLICLMESILIQEGVVESDYACFVARKFQSCQ